MKVAELREKAKEFEIETTGKKKAELVEEIYTTAAKAEASVILRASCRFARTTPASSMPTVT